MHSYANTNIFLIGPMGAGKTSVGKWLAKKMSRSFFDGDQEIEKAARMSIVSMFEQEGEESFRRRERKLIMELSALTGIIFSTGGGAVLSAENCQVLTEKGWVVYLRAGFSQLIRRLKGDTQRPLLKSSASFEQLIQERQQLYNSLADLTVDTDDCDLAKIGNYIHQNFMALCRN